MKAVLILLGLIATSYAIVCPPDICDRVDCADVTDVECPADLGEVQENAGICGCCPACVKYLNEGERCISRILLGVPSNVKCRSGLVCTGGKCLKTQ